MTSIGARTKTLPRKTPRKARAAAEIPIVFITGQGDIPTSVRAIKPGVTEFLTKPFADDDLLAAIRQALEKDAGARAESLVELVHIAQKIGLTEWRHPGDLS